jgi:hypothetical protein
MICMREASKKNEFEQLHNLLIIQNIRFRKVLSVVLWIIN